MICDQFKFTGPSARGTSTELGIKLDRMIGLNRAWMTHFNHSLTLSSCGLGIELMWRGGREKSRKIKTMSKCLRENCTRSSEATSISARVTTVNGGSDRCTRQSVVGCIFTLARAGTPSKARSRKGMSTSRRLSLYHRFVHFSISKGISVIDEAYLFSNLIGKMLELFIQGLSSLHLRLLELDFILVTVAVLSFAITSLVELNVRCFAIYLNVLITDMSVAMSRMRACITHLCLLLANNDRRS